MIASNGIIELVKAKDNSVTWSTNIHVPSKSSVVLLSDNSNLVLNDGTPGENLWQSFDHPWDTFLPGSVLGFNVKTGESFVLASWKSESDPSPRNFTLGISKQSPSQVFIWINGLMPHWRSRPWDKSKFIGIPESVALYSHIDGIQRDLDKGTNFPYFNLYNNSVLTKVFVSSQGILKSMLKVKVMILGILIWRHHEVNATYMGHVDLMVYAKHQDLEFAGV